MQINHRQLIRKLISSYQFVTDLGCRFFYDKGEIFFSLKHKNGFRRQFKLSGESIIQTEYVDFLNESNFIAGDIIDLVAWMHNWDFEEAINYIYNRYGVLLQQYMAHSKEAVMPYLISESKRNRLIFQKICGLTVKSGNEADPYLYKDHIAFLNRHNINTDYLGDSVIFFESKGKDLLELFNLISKSELLQEQKKILDSSKHGLVCIPYFSSHSILSHLEFIDIVNSKYFYYPINPSVISFAYLYAMDLSFVDNINNPISICENSLDALALTSNNIQKLNYNPIYAVSCKYSKGSKLNFDHSWFNKCIYWLKTDSSITDVFNFFKTIDLRDRGKIQIYNKSYFAISEEMTWDEYIESKFESEISEYKNNPNDGNIYIKVLSLVNYAKAFASICKNPNKFISNVIKLFKDTNESSLGNLLDCQLTYTEYDFKNFKVISTSNGYICRSHQNQDTDIIISNFVISIDSQTIFSDSQDIVLHGRLRIHDCDIPISLNKLKAQKVSYVETECITAFKNALNNPLYDLKNKSIPVVFDSQLGFYITECINRMSANAAIKQGVSHYGWDLSVTNNLSFIAPNWKIDSFGNIIECNTDSNLASNYLMENFNISKYVSLWDLLRPNYDNCLKQIKGLEKIREDIVKSGDFNRFITIYRDIFKNEYISVCKAYIGMLICLFLDESTPAIIYNDSPNARNVLSRIQRLWGQTNIYDVIAKRKNIDRAFIIPEHFTHLPVCIVNDREDGYDILKVLDGAPAIILDSSQSEDSIVNNDNILFSYGEDKFTIMMNFLVCSLVGIFNFIKTGNGKKALIDILKIKGIKIDRENKLTKEKYYIDIAEAILGYFIRVENNREILLKNRCDTIKPKDLEELLKNLDIFFSDSNRGIIQKYTENVTSEFIRLKYIMLPKDLRDVVLRINRIINPLVMHNFDFKIRKCYMPIHALRILHKNRGKI